MYVVAVEVRYIEKTRQVLGDIGYEITIAELASRLNYNSHWMICILNNLAELASEQEWVSPLLDLVIDYKPEKRLAIAQ